jgi:hypothetical protein
VARYLAVEIVGVLHISHCVGEGVDCCLIEMESVVVHDCLHPPGKWPQKGIDSTDDLSYVIDLLTFPPSMRGSTNVPIPTVDRTPMPPEAILRKRCKRTPSGRL